MCIESVMPSSHLILCCPLLFLPLIFPSIRVFSNESALQISLPKYWSFSLSPSNEHPGLVSFRMDWLDLLAVQGILNSLLQHHSSKAFVGKVMSLLFNKLSRLVITFLPRSKRLNFMAAVTICSDSGAQKIKSDIVSTVSHLSPMK